MKVCIVKISSDELNSFKNENKKKNLFQAIYGSNWRRLQAVCEMLPTGAGSVEDALWRAGVDICRRSSESF